jgi:hypothetical protein
VNIIVYCVLIALEVVGLLYLMLAPRRPSKREGSRKQKSRVLPGRGAPRVTATDPHR